VPLYAGSYAVVPRSTFDGGYTPEQRAEICWAIFDDIAKGNLVKDACARVGISRDSLHKWTEADRSLSDAYARARRLQAHAMAEHAIEISDGRDEQSKSEVQAMVEYIQGVDEESKERVLAALTQMQVQRDRLRVDTRKWLTSKIAPRDFGEKPADEAARPSVIFMPEAGLVEGRVIRDDAMKRIAESSSPDVPMEELPGYEYVDVDETPRELMADDPDAQPSVDPAIAPRTKEQEILARRHARRPVEGIPKPVTPRPTNGRK